VGKKSNRIERAGNAFGSLRKYLFSSPTVSYEVKGAAYTSLIVPIALYGSECWLCEKLLHEVRLFHHSYVRSMWLSHLQAPYLHGKA